MKPQLIILGAGAPREDGRPYGVQKVTLRGSVLDWLLDAFSKLEPDVCFVGGYDINAVMQKFPRLTYLYNAGWQDTGPVTSLALALESLDALNEGKSDLYVTYADILVRKDLVTEMINSGTNACAIAVDEIRLSDFRKTRKTETINLNGRNYEFVGLIRVPAKLVPTFCMYILKIANEMRFAHLSELISKSTLPLRAVASRDLWAHVENGRSVARFVLGSKAATLDRLKNRLKHSRILPLIYFKRDQWQAENKKVLEMLIKKFSRHRYLIVRSSATDEDGFHRVNAGCYHSELNVIPSSESLTKAINQVFASYERNDESDEVLVQPQLENVKASGVIFTRTLDTGAPWRVIHYSMNGDTTEITSGLSRGGLKLVVSRFSNIHALSQIPEPGRSIIKASDEIEQRVCHDALDIEFALDKNNEIITLQVRPLFVGDSHQDRNRDIEVADCLRSLKRVLNELSRPQPNQVGHDTVWSVMADWNPAEIIGLTPNPLAFDLYRYLITDSIWAEQRYQAGYRDLRGWPLVRSFCGHAYVDVRASLNSFIPAELPDVIAERLVDHAIDRLRNDRSLHDKIEFELLPTCIDFCFSEWRNNYKQNGIASNSELLLIQKSLQVITNRIINQTRKYLNAAQKLERRCSELEKSYLPFSEWLRHILSVCSQEGTLVFAHLARAGFVAASLLRSAVRAGYLTEKRRAELMESIPNIGSMLTNAAVEVRKGRMQRSDFISRFGHLRPGTYDINTPAYRDRPEMFLDPIIETAQPRIIRPFCWTSKEKIKLNKSLQDLNINVGADDLLNFIKTAVEGREYAKFVFTRLLSAVLDNLSIRGQNAGISSDRLAYMPLDFWLNQSIRTMGDNGAQIELKNRTEKRYYEHSLSSSILLPPVLSHENEIFAYVIPQCDPSFISQRRVRAPLRILNSNMDVSRDKVKGCVVAIKNADPGFDFLFAFGISGLVTAYGGPNSHMAIRASEYAIPAVIGIGEQAFSQLQDGEIIIIDCQQRLWSQEIWK